MTSAGGRRFGFTVGPAFMLLAVVLAWRDRTLAAAVTAGLGAVLVLAALLVPGRLGPVFRAWMGLAHAISRVTTPVVLGVVFFAVITPLGLLRRLFGKNPISRSPAAASYWVTRRGPRGTMSNQF